MNKLFTKWNGRSIADWGTATSKEFDSFYRQFVNAVKREFPEDEVLNCHKGHYDLSGFIKRDEKFVYFSFSVPRMEYPLDLTKNNAMMGILIRSARSE